MAQCSMRCLTENEWQAIWMRGGLGRAGLRTRAKFEMLTRLPETVGRQEAWLSGMVELAGGRQERMAALTHWNGGHDDSGIIDVVERFRKSFGESRPLREAPGHLFTGGELPSLTGLLRLVMAFEWGACFIAKDGTGIGFELFDIFLRIHCADAATLERVKSLFRSMGASELPPNTFRGGAG